MRYAPNITIVVVAALVSSTVSLAFPIYNYVQFERQWARDLAAFKLRSEERDREAQKFLCDTYTEWFEKYGSKMNPPDRSEELERKCLSQ